MGYVYTESDGYLMRNNRNNIIDKEELKKFSQN